MPSDADRTNPRVTDSADPRVGVLLPGDRTTCRAFEARNDRPRRPPLPGAHVRSAASCATPVRGRLLDNRHNKGVNHSYRSIPRSMSSQATQAPVDAGSSIQRRNDRVALSRLRGSKRWPAFSHSYTDGLQVTAIIGKGSLGQAS